MALLWRVPLVRLPRIGAWAPMEMWVLRSGSICGIPNPKHQPDVERCGNFVHNHGTGQASSRNITGPSLIDFVHHLLCRLKTVRFRLQIYFSFFSFRAGASGYPTCAAPKERLSHLGSEKMQNLAKAIGDRWHVREGKRKERRKKDDDSFTPPPF